MYRPLTSFFRTAATNIRHRFSPATPSLRRQSTATSTSQQPSKPLRGWRKYAHHFKDAPASHLAAFAVLHEATAIVPLPLIYYLLVAVDARIPFPEDVLKEANRRVTKLMKAVGFDSATLNDDSQAMIYMATSYAVVKALMPVRVALSLLMTPWLARHLALSILPYGVEG
eukprot:jgi/Hompol1/5992/HPOL_000157-RA